MAPAPPDVVGVILQGVFDPEGDASQAGGGKPHTVDGMDQILSIFVFFI
jgi:hypothetical protein